MKEKVSSPDSPPTMPQNPLLVPEVSDPTLARLLMCSTSELASATRPSFLANDHSPVREVSHEGKSALVSERLGPVRSKS